MTTPKPPERIHIVNALFLIGAPLFCVFAIPLEIARSGFQAPLWLLAVGLWVTTGLSITVGYHRLFSHRTFEARGWVRALFLFFGAGAVQNSALTWSADHRNHHAFTDTDRDPYNILRGFFYAHMGWVMLRTAPGYEPPTPKDLVADPWVHFQHRFYVPIMLISAFALPTWLGWLMTGNLWGSFLIAGLARIVVVHHFVFLINSAAHVFGTRPYSERTTARDSWWLAFFSFGEGYHNYHHSFEYDFRNGVKWYQWDPSKWVISALAWGGQASGLKRAPQKVIDSAHMKMEEQRLKQRGLETSTLSELKARVEGCHDRLKTLLVEYRSSRLEPLKKEIQQARKEMRLAWQEWKRSRRALAHALSK